jgi:hypothetical protein
VSWRLARAVVACGLFWCVFAAARPEAQSYPAFRSFLGVGFRTTPSAEGPVVAQVSPNSPAAAAGIQPGDVLKAVDGRPVTSAAEAGELLGFPPPFDGGKLDIERAGRRMTIDARPTGRVRLETLTLRKVFFIPGVETAPPPAPRDAVDALDAINVLTRVLIDPASGRVEFIGSYDRAYDTGPVPYRELLEAALRSPEPGFSLDLDAATLQRMRDLRARQDADLGRVFAPGADRDAAAWFRRWVDLILGHPLLEIDRQLFLDRMAAEVGLPKPDLVDLFNYVNMGGITLQVPAAILETQARLLEREGYAGAASAYRLYRQATPDSLARAADALGQGDAIGRLLAEADVAGRPDADRRAILQAFVACRLARSLGAFDDQQAAAYFAQFRQGRLPLATLDAWLQQRLLPDRRADGRYVVYQVMNGFPLSNELLACFYGVEAPQSVLRFDRVGGATALGRALYEADYALKTIDMTQEIFRTIPGHRTFRQIMIDAGQRGAAPVRLTLVPRDVELVATADRREVGFGPARIELESVATRIDDGTSVSEETLTESQKLADAYRAQINERYEQYAREYPPLHRLREVAKILALARWMNEQRIALGPAAGAAAGGERGTGAWTPPSRVPGLFHVFMVIGESAGADGRPRYSFLMPTAVEGGVTFATRKGWARVSQPPPTYEPAAARLTESAAIGQAAVRAAIDGNLEAARALAERSAQAMQGRLDRSQLPPQVVVPGVPPPGAASPDTARLVKEAARVVRQVAGETDGAAAARGADPARRALLSDLGRELNRAATGAPVASDFLRALQTRQVGPPAAPASQSLQPARAGASGPALASICEQYRADLASGGDLTPAQQAFYDAKLAALRQDLDRVERAMAAIARLGGQDAAELAKWEQEVSAAYQAAQDRMIDAVGLLLVDGPLDVLQKRQAEMREAIGSGLLTSLLARKAAVTADEAAALDGQAFAWLKMKYRYEAVYGQAERLGKRMTEAKAVYDLDQWASSDTSDFEKMKEGIGQLVEMALGDPAVGGALKVGGLTGDTLLRWLSLYKAAAIGAGFLGDIVAQRLAWGPVMERLEQSIEQHRQAVERLGQRAAGLRQQIQCLESARRSRAPAGAPTMR